MIALEQRGLLALVIACAIAAALHPVLAALLAMSALAATLTLRWSTAAATPALAVLPAVVVGVFNFESLIARIGVPFVNPFNAAWLLAVGVLVLNRYRSRDALLPRTSLDVPLLVNIAVTAVSLVTAWQALAPAVWFDKFMVFEQWLQWLAFFWVVAALVRGPDDARPVVAGVVLMVAIAGLFGIRDYVATRAVSGGAIERSQGLFGQANYAASFFAYYLPLVAALLVRVSGRRWRLFHAAALIVGAVALTLTFGRGGILGAAGGMLVIIAATRSRALVFGAVVAALIIGSVPEVRLRFAETVGGNGGGGHQEVELDDSSGARLIAWQKAGALIRSQPLTGHGYYSFRYLDHPLDREAAARFGHGRMDVHNGHLNVAVSSGVPGLLALYLQFGAIAWWCLRCRARSSDPFVRALAEGLLAAVLAIMLVNLTGTRLYDRQLVGYFWILLGCLHGAARAGETAPSPPASR